MRRDGTKPEALMWLELKAKRLGGHHFVRQLPIGSYIADFACRKARLIVELDGSQHAGSESDRRRDEFLGAAGWSTLRFWNDDILKHRTSVCETILAALDGRLAEDIAAFDLRFAYAGYRGASSASTENPHGANPSSHRKLSKPTHRSNPLTDPSS